MDCVKRDLAGVGGEGRGGEGRTKARDWGELEALWRRQ